MPRPLRLLLLLLPALMAGTVFGWALGSFATGESPSMTIAGYTPPEQGSNVRSASAADAVQPAAASFVPGERYSAASQRW